MTAAGDSADNGAGIVIVGGGIAGASAAEALRREGYAGRVTLVGEEAVPPYERPPLSKEFLLGRLPEERLFPRPAEGYAAEGIELLLGERAVALDVAAHQVRLASGRNLPYRRALIVTGSVPLRLSVPGVELPGVLTLRTVADARVLAEGIRATGATGGRVVIVGAGFIGAEVAADCRMLGVAVTLIEQLGAPMERVLGPEVGGLLAEVHRTHGVDLRLGEAVAAFRGDGRVEEVVTASGARIPCALALVGVGVRPADEWLAGSGVARQDGVLVDAFCQTSVPDVFAAGDVANWPYTPPGSGSGAGADAGGLPAERVRVEHWDNALRQPEAAARAMLGRPASYAPVPYFWSDQYDLKLQYVGYARRWDQLVTRGRLDDGTLAAFYLAGGRIAAALSANRPRELVALKRLVGAALDPSLLADAALDFKALLARVPRL
ncbi:MAG TPA: FAD-dependent oxidoreductase [Ktedonobacterales bacterium]|nr:FAD-dependent oxidoreductase [Ktedonobacterales bacterium]